MNLNPLNFTRARCAWAGLAAIVLLLNAPWSAASAGLLDDDEARKAILDLRAEVRKNDTLAARQIEELRAQIVQLKIDLKAEIKTEIKTEVKTDTNAEIANVVASINISNANNNRANQALNSQQDTTKQALLTLNNQITQLREDNAKLRGQLEAQQNEQQQQAQRAGNANQVTQATLAALNSSDALIDARLKKLEPRAIAVDGKEAVVDRSEETNFNAALAQFKAADYKAASTAFGNFIAQYPQSALLPSAYFWQGNSLYAARDAKNALSALQNFLQKAPDHPRAADAYLTIAYCHNELGDKRRAQVGFAYVVQTFPDTPAAETAQGELPKPAVPKKKT